MKNPETKSYHPLEICGCESRAGVKALRGEQLVCNLTKMMHSKPRGRVFMCRAWYFSWEESQAEAGIFRNTIPLGVKESLVD